jgi:hypothetical protein
MDLASEELLSATIASYMPDRQLITFSAAMQVIPEEGNSRGLFQGPHVIGYFFHEWFHYLHNVSTIHGISAFASLVSLWSAYRWTTDERGFGQGAFTSGTPEEFKTEDLLTLLKAARMRRGKSLPT